MRLGAQECRIVPGTLAHAVYGRDRSWNGIATATSSTTAISSGYRRRGSSSRASRGRAGGDHRAARHPWFIACQFHPEFNFHTAGRAPAVRRIHPRRAPATGRRSCRLPPAHETAWISTSVRPAAFPDRRALRRRERRAGHRHGRQAQGDHAAARHPVHLQVLLRQGQSFLGSEFPRARVSRRACVCCRKSGGSCSCRCSPTCTRTRRSRKWLRKSWMSCRRQHSSAGRPTSFAQRRLPRQARQYQEGPVPVPVGNAERSGQGACHRQ